IQDLRDLSKSLNTDYIKELGLIRAIEYELEIIKKSEDFETQLDIEGKQFRLEEKQELIFFRIVQEVLHNIIKHAKATKIHVHSLFGKEVFSLSITDNGVGFDTGMLEINNYNSSGLGIRNMYNRSKMIDADFKLVS